MSPIVGIFMEVSSSLISFLDKKGKYSQDDYLCLLAQVHEHELICK